MSPLSLCFPARGDAMAAASSSRARAGPPCEKSQLSVKGGSCFLTRGGARSPAVGNVDFGCIWSGCVLCLHPRLGDLLGGCRGWERPALPCVPCLPREAERLLSPVVVRTWLRGREMAPDAWSCVPPSCVPGAAPAQPRHRAPLAWGAAEPHLLCVSTQRLWQSPPCPQFAHKPWGRVVSVGTVTLLQP